MVRDFYESETWMSISSDRQEVLRKVFDLYCIYPIRKEILDGIDPLGVQYQLGKCHQNSELFARQIGSCYECILVEGVAINAKGEAFMHYWNRFKSLPSCAGASDEAEYDVTHDLLMPDQLPFLYHAVKEYRLDDLQSGSVYGFCQETEDKLGEYLAILPEARPEI